jgi:hypothetical protein
MGAGRAESSQTGSTVKGSGLDSHTVNGNNLDGLNNSEAEADQMKLSAGPAPAEASAISLVATSTLTMGESLRLSSGTGQGIGLSVSEVSGAGPLSSSVVAHAEAFAAQPVVVAAASYSVLPSSVKTISTKTSTRSEEKKPAAVGSKSAEKSTPAQTIQAVHDLASSEAVQAAVVQVPVPAVAASIPQSATAAVTASSVARGTNAQAQWAEAGHSSVPAQTSQAAISSVQAQPAEADLPAALPTGRPTDIAATFFTPPSMQLDAPCQISSGEVSEAANFAVNRTTVELEGYAKEGQASTVPSLRGSSGLAISGSSTPAFNATVLPNVQHGVSRPAATLAGERILPEMPLLGQNPAPGEMLSQTPATKEAPIQSTAPSFVPSQSTTPTLAQSLSEIPAQLVSQGVAVIPAVTAGAELNSLPVATSDVVFQSGQPSNVVPIESKLGAASGGKFSAPGRLRSAHRAGTADSVQQVSRLAAGQPAALAVDASALMLDLASAPKMVSTAGVASALDTGPDLREVFATLDAGGAPGRPAWIHAGAQRAEAGFQDPALGWVGVRADSSSGGVRAELVAGSADAAQALSSHMAGLNAYLAERHTPVESLTLAASQGESSGAGSDRGAEGGMQQGAGQQSGQGADTSSSSGLPIERSAAADLPAPSVWQEGSAQAATPGGVHISVMA